MTRFLNPGHSTLDQAVTRAEMLFAGFLVEHNIALSAADHAGNLFRSMFLNQEHSASDIIKKYSAARTKTTHMVHEMASNKSSDLVEAMKSLPFCIATDASNDKSEKLFPIVVRMVKDGCIRTELLSILELNGKGTGENISQLILQDLCAKDIPFSNCIAYTSDNANVMVGEKSGVLSYLRALNPELISTGCVCHRFDLAADWASRQLPMKVENFFLDVFYYMDKSSNRIKTFHDFQESCGVGVSQVCKHCPTRWLSLGKSCDWFLRNWEPLREFFSQECNEDKINFQDSEVEDHGSRKTNALSNLSSRTMKLYVLYLSYVIPLFDKANLQLQHEEPMIHRQRKIMAELLRDLQLMFIKPCAMTGKEVHEVDIKSKYNHQDERDIMVGAGVREFIKTSNLSKDVIKKFYTSVVKFLMTACSYLSKHLPFTKDFIRHAEVADIGSRQNAKFDSVRFFISKFPELLPSNASLDSLEVEFRRFLIHDVAIDKSLPMDQQWQALSNEKNAMGETIFKVLPSVMMTILSIPHSNASCERIFSLVRKNRSDFRASMSVRTLQSLLVLKQSSIKCFEERPSTALINRCKGATHAALSGKQN